MHTVGVEELLRGRVVAFRLDALHLAEEPAAAFAECFRIHHHEVRFAIALPLLDRLRVGHEPPHDHLAVAHVVLFDLRPLAHTAELHQRVARVRLVFGAHDVVLVGGGDDPQLDQLRIGQKIQSDEVGTCFLERREVLLDQLLRGALDPRRHLSRCVADDLVHVGRELTREIPELPRALGFLRCPHELGPHRGRRRAVACFTHVRQRDRLAAVLLADLLIVRQVDPHGRHGPRVAGLDDDVDGVGHDAFDVRLAVLRVPRHTVFEPLRVFSELVDARRLFPVHVEDKPLPPGLDPAWIEIDLDEAVDGVDGRALVLHPGDVVLRTVGVLSRAVPLDERAERVRHRLGGKWNGGLEVLDDPGDLRPITAVDAIDLLDQASVALLHEA